MLAKTWVDPNRNGYADLVRPLLSGGSWRIVIPAEGRASAGWLQERSNKTVLVEFAEPGRICMLPWEPYGRAVVERRNELAQSPDEGNLEERIQLTERYRTISVEEGGRFPLHDRERFHLGLSGNDPGSMLVICMSDRIELWTEEFRLRWRETSEHRPPWLIDT
jgi:hypothetical protein